MSTNSDCIICGRTETENAHVKPRREFNRGEDDRFHNLISLCRIHHHDYFDKGKIGICSCKQRVVIEQTPGSVEVVDLDRPLNIKDEYVEYRNRRCRDRVRHGMGFTHDSTMNLCEK